MRCQIWPGVDFVKGRAFFRIGPVIFSKLVFPLRRVLIFVIVVNRAFRNIVIVVLVI